MPTAAPAASAKGGGARARAAHRPARHSPSPAAVRRIRPRSAAEASGSRRARPVTASSTQTGSAQRRSSAEKAAGAASTSGKAPPAMATRPAASRSAVAPSGATSTAMPPTGRSMATQPRSRRARQSDGSAAMRSAASGRMTPAPMRRARWSIMASGVTRPSPMAASSGSTPQRRATHWTRSQCSGSTSSSTRRGWPGGGTSERSGRGMGAARRDGCAHDAPPPAGRPSSTKRMIRAPQPAPPGTPQSRL